MEEISTEILEDKLVSMKNELAYFEDEIGRIETELFYRKHPESRPKTP